MRYPHPWLARVARVGMTLGLTGFLAAAGIVLMPGHSGLWYGSRLLASWEQAAAAGQQWTSGREQFEDSAVAVLVPGGWLLAAGLLRLAATGRLRLTGPVAPHWRWLAVTGMGFSAVAVGCGAARWESPIRGPGGNYRALNRLRAIVEDGVAFRFDHESTPAVGSRSMSETNHRPGSPMPSIWTTAFVLFGEAYALFACVRTAGVFFLLSATVYCFNRRDPDAET